jgi:hypothetical protein
MIRFIIKRNFRPQFCGGEAISYETVDIDVPELERILLGGGYGPDGHDMRELAGVVIIPDEKQS